MAVKCIFCQIVAGHEPATAVNVWRDAWAIVPVAPVTPGHLLIIPFEHADTAATNPRLAGLTIQYAAQLLSFDWPGRNGATDFFLGHNVGGHNGGDQTQFHIHAQLIPRRPGDGLLMPWSVQQGTEVVVQEGSNDRPPGDQVEVCESGSDCAARDRHSHTRTVITTPWTEVETGSRP